MKIDKRNIAHWALLIQQGCYSLLAALLRLLRAKPKTPVVILYGHQLSGNLKALYTACLEDKHRSFECYFLSLDPSYSAVLRQEGVRVLQCNRLQDMLLVGRSSVVITDHGLHAMSPLISLTNIKFVDVWHGIPFKGFTPATFAVQRRYDEVWVSSQLLKKVYVEKFGFEESIVMPLGYARADKLFRGHSARPSFKHQQKLKADQKIVLYAPTWQQENAQRSLFPFGQTQDGFIENLNNICQEHDAILVIRSHLNADIANTQFDNVIYCPMKVFPDTESLLQESDILICDWSSIAFDYLALKHPTIFLDVEPPFKNGFSLGPEYRYASIASAMSELTETLDQALGSPTDFMNRHEEQYEKIIEAVYGESRDGAASERQLARIKALAESSQ